MGEAIGNYVSLGLRTFGLFKNTSTTQAMNRQVENLKEILEGYLGENYIMKKNDSGDLIFINPENTRRIRFDVFDPHGELPHGHVEIKVDKRWKDFTDCHRINIKVEPRLNVDSIKLGN